MAATATTLLALCALLAGSSADDPYCTTKTYGDTSGSLVPMKPVSLPPPTKSWDIQTNTVTACGEYAHPVGLAVRTCDYNGPPPPTVSILSVDEVIVERNTYPQTEGVVEINVYCEPNTTVKLLRPTIGKVNAVPRN